MSEATEAVTAETTDETANATAATNEAATAEAAAPAGPTKEEITEALGKFETLVNEVLGQPEAEGQAAVVGKINQQNGEVAAEDMAAIIEAYKALPGGTRTANKAQELLQKSQMTALTEYMWAVGARAYSLIILALRDAGKTSRPKAETVAKPTVNPTEAHVALGAAHALAVNFLPVGSDVDPSWGNLVNEKVQSLRDEVVTYNAYLAEKAKFDALTDEEKAEATEPVQPEVDAIVLQAARLARGRTPGAKKAPREPKAGGAAATPRDPSAPRGDILAHIQEVFASQPVGAFLKVSEIAKVGTSQYGAGQVSGGAIAARIKSPKFAEVAGLAFEDAGQGQGVRKTA